MSTPVNDDEPVLTPLCRECVRELPVEGSDLCEFCRVVMP